MHTKKLVYVITYHLSFGRKNMVWANESAQFREELTKNWNEVMRRKRDEILRTWEVRDPNFGRCGTFCSIENSKFNAWTAYRMHYSENDNSLITVLISRKLTFSRIDVKGSKSVNKYKNFIKNMLKFIFYLLTGGSLKWPIIVGPGSGILPESYSVFYSWNKNR